MKVILTKDDKTILEELVKTGIKDCLREKDKDSVCEECKYNRFDCFDLCIKCSPNVLRSKASNILNESELDDGLHNAVTQNELVDYIDDEELTNGTIFLDDFDSSIIGYTYNDDGIAVVIYSRNKILKRLMYIYEMTEKDAEEWLQFNIEPVCTGKGAPIIMECLPNE